jgi:hypothetical protein
MSCDGKWGTISLEIPDYLEDVREAINSVAELLITFLDIAIAALQLLKAFAVGYLDPLFAIIQAIIALINGLLEDFANLGIYITHDMALAAEGWPWESLRGGYAEYERRMIARLTDRSDRTRPNLSANTPVFAGFFYLSVDISDIERLWAFILQLLAFFDMKFFPESGLPTPVIDRVDFGANATGVFGGLSSLLSFDESPPNKARVTWKVPQPSRKGPTNPLSAFSGPSAFIITVSTVPDGIPLFFDRPEADSGSTRKKGLGPLQQRREQGAVRDETGKPVVLYGGDDQLDFEASTLGWNNAVSGGSIKNGAARVFGKLREGNSADTSVIPLESLRDGETYYLQRTFTLSSTAVAFQWATQEFSIVLELKDMPHHADFEMSGGEVTLVDRGQPSTYYVRVSSTSSKVTDKGFEWDFRTAAPVSGMKAGEPFRVGLRADGISPTSISEYSTPRQISFPTANHQKFLDAIQAALVMLVLSRSDLPTVDELAETKGDDFVTDAQEHKVLLNNVALVRTGLEPFKDLIEHMFPDFAQVMTAKGGNQLTFRQDLARQAEMLANHMMDTSGFTTELIDFVVDSTVNLREATWGEILLAAGETKAVEILSSWRSDTPLDHVRGFRRSPTEEEQAELKVEYDELEAAMLAGQIQSLRAGEVFDETEIQKQRVALRKQLAALRNDTDKPPAGAGAAFGIAPNPYSAGIPAANVDTLFGISEVVRWRKPHFIEYNPAEFDASLDAISRMITAPVTELVQEFMEEMAPSLRAVAEKYVLPDGTLELPSDVAESVSVQTSQKRIVGSVDLSPVFHFGQDLMTATVMSPTFVEGLLEGTPIEQAGMGMLYTRSLLANFEGGVLYQEAALVLKMSGAAALRSPQDGEWIAIRFFDAWPDVENFFESLQNWLAALAAAVQSIAATIVAYIEFIEARLVELQQLIRRLNALILAILSFTPKLPQFSGLLLIEPGTSGIIRGFTSAEEKPLDSPLAHGAGVAIVMALLPGVAGSIAAEFIQSLLVCSPGAPDPDGSTGVSGGGDAFGVNGIPEPPVGPGPNDPPDVL